MDGVAVGLAFSAGALSVANPCALAMIPAYVALRTQSATGGAAPALIVTGVGGLLLGFVGVLRSLVSQSRSPGGRCSSSSRSSRAWIRSRSA